MNNETSPLSTGVQDLIDKLHEKGLEQGKAEGARIVEDAERHAQWIVEQAKVEAQKIVHEANQEAEFVKKAGPEALELAYRDTVLAVKTAFTQQFVEHLEKMLVNQLQEAPLLETLLKLIIEQQMLGQSGVSLVLPKSLLSKTTNIPKQSSKNGAQGQETNAAEATLLQDVELSQFIKSQIKELLKEGLTLDFGHQNGLVLRWENGKVSMDFTDEILNEVLLHYVQPRFRALLDGLIG